jgi:hypothetical protein
MEMRHVENGTSASFLVEIFVFCLHFLFFFTTQRCTSENSAEMTQLHAADIFTHALIPILIYFVIHDF